MLIEDTGNCPRKALLALFDIGSSQFHALKNAGVFEPVGRGTYDLRQAIQGYLQYHLNGQTGGTIAEEKRLLVIAQRRQIEQRTELEAARLIELEQAHQTISEVATLITGQMEALPGRMANSLAGVSDPAEIRHKLLNEVRRIRNAAADKLEAWASDNEGREPDESTAAADGE